MRIDRKIIGSCVFVFILFVMLKVEMDIFFPKNNYFAGYDENFWQNTKGLDTLPANSIDILILGSSNVFMDISPVDLYNDFGYKSYELGTPRQTLEQSLWQLKYSLRSQKPKVVVLDCLAFTGYSENGENGSHMAYDAYPLSIDKIIHLKKYLNTDYAINDFIIPFYLYHNRYGELDSRDIELKEYGYKEDFLGYSPVFSVSCTEKQLLEEKGSETIVSDRALSVFYEIKNICNSNGIELVLVKTPCAGSWFAEDSIRVQQLANENDLMFWDFNKSIVLDNEKDWSDDGEHLNDDGGKKMTYELGWKIREELEDKVEFSKMKDPYFDKRVESLDNCRRIQRLTRIKDMQKLKEVLEDEDYIIEYCVAPNNGYWQQLMSPLIGISIDNTRNVGLVDREDNVLLSAGDNEFEYSYGGNIFYGRVNDEGGYLQHNYHNYYDATYIRNAMIVYSKYYGEVVDMITLQENDGIMLVNHSCN